MGRFHKALPNIKSAYVTLQNFTPDFKKKLHRYICRICDIMQLCEFKVQLLMAGHIGAVGVHMTLMSFKVILIWSNSNIYDNWVLSLWNSSSIGLTMRIVKPTKLGFYILSSTSIDFTIRIFKPTKLGCDRNRTSVRRTLCWRQPALCKVSTFI